MHDYRLTLSLSKASLPLAPARFRSEALWILLPLALLCGLLPLPSRATTGVFVDQGGAVFNVVAYRKSTATDDSQAAQDAINAAIAAGGGVVYFPAGSYVIGSTVTNSRSDIVSLVGSGMGSQLTINTAIGFSLTRPAARAQYHSGNISHLKFICTNTSAYTAVQMVDLVTAPELHDLDIAACNIGFDLVNQSYWTERLVAVNITDDNNNHLFRYNPNPSVSGSSYGYGTYSGIYINKAPGQDVFYLTGGAYLYHSSFIIKGNFDSTGTGASIFNVQGASQQPCPGAAYNTYDIAVEGTSYAVVNAANNGCIGGATGNALVAGIGTIDATGATSGTTSLIKVSANSASYVGLLTTTAASSDTLSAPVVSPGTTCYTQPANAIAASQMLTGTYVSGTNWGIVTVTHPAIAGGAFQVWCR